MGLSPILTEQIFAIISEINAQGTTVLLVEQNALMALNAADRGYVIQTGQDHPRRHRGQPRRQRAGAPGLPRRDLTAVEGRPEGDAPGPKRPQDYRPDVRPMMILGVLLVAVVVAWILLSPLILPGQ